MTKSKTSYIKAYYVTIKTGMLKSTTIHAFVEANNSFKHYCEFTLPLDINDHLKGCELEFTSNDVDEIVKDVLKKVNSNMRADLAKKSFIEEKVDILWWALCNNTYTYIRILPRVRKIILCCLKIHI